jgi:hypothetical protein
MKILFLILSFSFCTHFILGQKNYNQIGVSLYTQRDWYPQFYYSINPTNTNFAKIKGTSWGSNGNYKLSLGKELFLKVGAGFYRYSFNKIEGKNTQFGNSTSRIIDFPSPLYVIFVTDKYWYNTLSTNIGVEKVFDVNKNWQISAGVSFTNYYTFSQTYHMTPDYPVGPPDHKYRLKNNRYLGLSSSLELGFLKKINQISIGPVLILPVYNMWKQDKVFPKNENSAENNSDGRHKWFRGIGFGINCNYSLTKK